MKIYMLKTFLVWIAILLAIPSIRAQFDDVYYDPDFPVTTVEYTYEDPGTNGAYQEEDVLYYDNDEYSYYEDDDFYYSSRIRRFYRPYVGFGFYDPIYIGYNYYDPYAYDYYGYPQSNFYLSFGFGIGFGSYYNNWYNPYYGYNNWYYPSYTYWGGCNSYYPYGGYNNYCPPIGCYNNGIVNTHVNYGNNGNYPGSYYGPRVTGNTGSSPRGPATNPGIVDRTGGNVVAGETGSKPVGITSPGSPGREITPTTPVVAEGGAKPLDPTISKGNTTNGVVRQIPVDREITGEPTASTDKRPVFRPDPNKYQPYPTSGRTTPGTSVPRSDTPSGRNDLPGSNPSGTPNAGSRPGVQAETPDRAPIRTDQIQGYKPSDRTIQDRPTYTPPQRHNDRSEQASPQRENDRPSYSPPRHDSQPRSNDRPSYSPPSRSDNGGGNSRSGYSPSSSGRESAPSGGSRSSGGGSSGSSSSARGRD